MFTDFTSALDRYDRINKLTIDKKPCLFQVHYCPRKKKKKNKSKCNTPNNVVVAVKKRAPSPLKGKAKQLSEKRISSDAQISRTNKTHYLF